MKLEIDDADWEVLLESSNYSKLFVSGSESAPEPQRREKLDRIDAVSAKLRKARKESSKSD